MGGIPFGSQISSLGFRSIVIAAGIQWIRTSITMLLAGIQWISSSNPLDLKVNMNALKLQLDLSDPNGVDQG
jgi:hypothetical protein